MTPRLDIVLPCYNPILGWEQTVVLGFAEVRAALPSVTIRLFIVNDGSTRNVSPTQIAWLKTQIPELIWLDYPTNKGKGHALRYGVRHAEAHQCIFTDIDFPYATESLLAVYQALEQGADLALGNRDEHYYDQVPAARKRISKSLRWLASRFLRLPVTDTQCGLKGFSPRGRAVFLRTAIDRYLFDLELIFLGAREKGLVIVPVPVSLKPDIVFSHMNASVLVREGWSFVRIFFRAWFRKD